MHEKREFIWIESGDRVSGFGRSRIMVPTGTQLHSHSLKLRAQSNHKSNLIFPSRKNLSSAKIYSNSQLRESALEFDFFFKNSTNKEHLILKTSQLILRLSDRIRNPPLR